MSNRKKAEEYFYDEYKEISNKVYIGYTKGLKQRLSREGHSHLLLFKNGTAEKILCEYIKNIFEEYTANIINVMDVIKEEFEVSFTLKFINDFKIKNDKNVDSYMDSIEKELKNIVEQELCESTKISLNSIKKNTKLNVIKELNKKNDSIKRLLKKQNKKDGILASLKKVTLESFIGWLISFLLGLLVGNYDRIINFFINAINK